MTFMMRNGRRCFRRLCQDVDKVPDYSAYGGLYHENEEYFLQGGLYDENKEVGHSEILYSLGLWKGGVLLIVISLPQVHNRLVFV